MRSVICIILFITGFSCFAQSRNRYVVMQNNKCGYIDNSGKIVIEPKFRSASNFREGLAAVRENELYGYIDSTGKYAIKPRFDYGEDFSSGIARIYIDGKPFYINKNDTILFQHDYESIDSFSGNRALVITKSGEAGFINKQGELVIDTLFKSASQDESYGLEHALVFQNNRAVVKRRLPDELHYAPLEIGLIDSNGKFIIPFGIYEKIDGLRNGFAMVTTAYSKTKEGSYKREEFLIDLNGNKCFSIPVDNWELTSHDPHVYDGLAVVAIKQEVPDTIRKRGNYRNEYYYGAVDTFGHLVFSNKNWEDITAFDHNRAFAKRKDAKWVLIDRQGKQVGNKAYSNICYNHYEHEGDRALFKNGTAFVCLDSMIGGIDTDGNFVIKPRDIHFSYWYIIRKDSALLFVKDLSDNTHIFLDAYGFWDTRTNIILPPRYDFIDFENFKDNIFEVVENGVDKYIDHYGETIWKGDKATDGRFDIDYMNNAFRFVKDDSALESDIHIPENVRGLLVFFDTTQRTKWTDHYNTPPRYDAHLLYVANMTNDTLFFPGLVGSISLILQAKDKHGVWRDIEYLPHSWCGNAYGEKSLAPGQHWEISSPIYYGQFKTKIRAALEYHVNEGKNNKILTVYSEEINGSINPAQFWRMRHYNPKEMKL